MLSVSSCNPSRLIQVQRFFSIRIDSYQNRNPAGCVFHCRFPEGKPFVGVIALIELLEETMDTENCPDVFNDELAAPFVIPRSRQAVFNLCIPFRKNRSWQGYVICPESGQRLSFQSALELFAIMDGVLAD